MRSSGFFLILHGVVSLALVAVPTPSVGFAQDLAPRADSSGDSTTAGPAEPNSGSSSDVAPDSSRSDASPSEPAPPSAAGAGAEPEIRASGNVSGSRDGASDGADGTAQAGGSDDADGTALVQTGGSDAETNPAISPKVVIVVVGDPDEVLRNAARDLEGRLEGRELRLPSDPALRAALIGEPGAAGDGLEAIRAVRRGLGLDESADIAGLQRLAQRAGASMVVVVRAASEGAEVLALHAELGRYFDGSVVLPRGAGRVRRFVVARARAVGRLTEESQRAEETHRASVEVSRVTAESEPASPESEVDHSLEAAANDSEDKDEVMAWFEQNWPYFVAGGLLIAVGAFIAVSATDNGEPPPMIRFQSGP